MKRSSMVAWLAAALVLAGCSEAPPTGPSGDEPDATAFTDADTGSLDAVNQVFFSDSFNWAEVVEGCEEDVYLEGYFAVRGHRVLTPSDHWNYVANYKARGEGYGLSSGAPYKWSGNGSFHQNIGPVAAGENPWIEKEVTTDKLIGPGPTRRQRHVVRRDVSRRASRTLETGPDAGGQLTSGRRRLELQLRFRRLAKALESP